MSAGAGLLAFMCMALIAWVFILLGERDHHEEMAKWWEERTDYWFTSSMKYLRGEGVARIAIAPKKARAPRKRKR